MMAATLVPDLTFSTLCNDASKWSHPTPDYEYYVARVSAPTPTILGTVIILTKYEQQIDTGPQCPHN